MMTNLLMVNLNLNQIFIIYIKRMLMSLNYNMEVRDYGYNKQFHANRHE